MQQKIPTQSQSLEEKRAAQETISEFFLAVYFYLEESKVSNFSEKLVVFRDIYCPILLGIFNNQKYKEILPEIRHTIMCEIFRSKLFPYGPESSKAIHFLDLYARTNEAVAEIEICLSSLAPKGKLNKKISTSPQNPKIKPKIHEFAPLREEEEEFFVPSKKV